MTPAARSSRRRERAIERTRRHVAPHRVAVWEELGTQIVIGAREGYRITDLCGHQLLDFHLNGGTFNLGHRNAELVGELVGALSDLDIGNHHFVSEPRAELGERLARATPGDLTYAVFASGGSEAIDIAIKSARHATGRRNVVALGVGYHGRTGLSGAAGDDAVARYFLSDLRREFLRVPFGDLDAMAAALRGRDVAAVVLETVPATYGFPVPPPDYLPTVRALCDEFGSLYIADEVQTGLGRTGHLWGVEAFGVTPDVLVTAKGLSGGLYPIAAVILAPRAATWLHENGWGHVSTFGGAELGCRIASRVLEITTRPQVREHVDRLIARFRAGLAEIAAREPFLVDVRQTGLMIGLQVAHPDGAVFLQQELHALGVWAIASGFDQSVLQFKPGLLLSVDDADTALDSLERALRQAKDADRPVPRRHRTTTSEGC